MIASAKLFDFFLISNFLCKKHRKNATWKLIRPDRFQPITWKLSCEQCRIENPNYEPLDILRYPCNHKYRSNHNSPLYEMNASFTFLYLALGMSNS